MDPFVDLLAQPGHLALGDAAHAHGLHQIIHRARRDALDVGFLDHRRQRLFSHPPGLQKTGEVTATAQPGDAQLDRAGPRLPVTLAVTVALYQTLSALLAVRRARQRADLQFHQPLAGKTDHLTQQIRVRALLQQRPQVHHLFGHRWFL